MAAVEYEVADDEMLDDSVEVQAAPRLRSKVTAVRKQKGRGFRGEAMDDEQPEERRGGQYDALSAGTGPGPQKCACRYHGKSWHAHCPEVPELPDWIRWSLCTMRCGKACNINQMLLFHCSASANDRKLWHCSCSCGGLGAVCDKHPRRGSRGRRSRSICRIWRRKEHLS